MTYTVYAQNAKEVEKRLEKIGRKANKYGIPFCWHRGEEHPQIVNIYEPDPPYYQSKSLVASYTVAAVDFEVECDGLIKASGWKVVAMIEHGEEGNIVTPFGNEESDHRWYSAPPRCDHCNTNRHRSTTFIVRHDDGTIKQVGKGCLKEYTGIIPSSAVLWAEIWQDLTDNFERTREEFEEDSSWVRMLKTSEVIGIAYDLVKKYGYVSRDKSGSTVERVASAIHEKITPSAEGLENADKIIEWLIDCGLRARIQDRQAEELEEIIYGIDEYGQTYVVNKKAQQDLWNLRNAWDHVGDIERNCVPFAKSGWVRPRDIGRLVYMPVAYGKYWERKAKAEAREAERLAAATASAHVGDIGERITITAVKAQLITSWETQYGYTYLYKFVDESGNVYIWYASGSWNIPDGAKIKGTVKDHNERDGVKQTVLSRCKII